MPPSSRFPRSTRVFVGRTTELSRLVEHADDEVLFLICGVAGIGKTEFAIRALEEMHARPLWRDAGLVTVAMQPGMEIDRLATELRFGLDPGLDTDGTSSLDAIVTELSTNKYLVLIEDLHILADDAASQFLGTLARSVRGSCVLVTSRRELRLSPTPLVTHLKPLDEVEGTKMVELLASSLDVVVSDPAAIVARSGGSPFYIEHLVAGVGGLDLSGADVLERSLEQLDPGTRRTLLRVSVLGVPVELSRFSDAVEVSALQVLARRFLIDLDHGSVRCHDLVRNAISRLASTAERIDAHRWAAELHTQQFVQDPAGYALDGIEATRHLCVAGRNRDALELVIEHHRAISRAGVDHLLVDILHRLRVDEPGYRVAIECLLARILLRRSRIAEAQAALAACADDPTALESAVYVALVSGVALRTGDLATAEAALRRALALSGGSRRRHLSLYIADLRSLRGDSDGARELLGPEEVAGGAESSSGRLRWAWSYVLSLVLDQKFLPAVAMAHRFRNEAAVEARDLGVQLAMLEVVSHAELGDARAARMVVDEIVAPAARAGALREKHALFLVGLAAWIEGDLHTARRLLEEAYGYLQRNRDDVLACFVGHYLGRTLVALDESDAAARLLEDTATRADEIGMETVAPFGHAHAARALLHLGRLGAAQEHLSKALGSRTLPPRGRAFALRVAALAAGMRADLDSARALLADAAQLLEPDDAMARSELAADRAEVELSGGDANAVIAHARIALTSHHDHGTRYHEARAGILLAAGHVVAGGRGNQVVAAHALDAAATLAEAAGGGYLTARSALVRAAIANRDGDRPRADALLTREVTRRYAKGAGFVIVLKSALQHLAEPNLMPGPTAFLRALGLLPDKIDIVLVVERSAGKISTTTGHSVAGRNLLCELLARLIESSGRPVTAEDLYRSVWGTEYHPLRHRNTLYSAISRLRQVLSQLVPDQGELIETTRDGWYLRAAGRVTS